MSIKDAIIKLINAVYRSDKFTNDYTEALGIVFQRLIDFCNSIKNNQFFDRLDEDGAQWWENHLKITPTKNQTLKDRQARIQAKYLSDGHNEIKLIQQVCDAWQNGEVEADFENGKIKIEFIASYGVPSDLDSLKESIEEIKPAHLPLMWVYRYLRKRDIHQVLTKSQMQSYRKNQYQKFQKEINNGQLDR